MKLAVDLLRRFVEMNDRFAETAGQVLSWSIWLTLIVIGTAVWILVDHATHGTFDPGYGTLVLILTIQTALDAGATKLFQLSLRRSDERRDAQMMLHIESIANLAVQIREELDRSRARDEAQVERDAATERRDKALRQLVTKLIDHVEERRAKGVRRRG